METLTIEGIAKLAGVSQATVSRVINNSDLVSETTRIKVNKLLNKIILNPKMLLALLQIKTWLKPLLFLCQK